mmetsp:Transcript_18952/g.47344  ORF Transcript_18952/g.47344 Transcript_18952/m.47344 type:complete len:201 (-) Transcript_18952:543-1145(-)
MYTVPRAFSVRANCTDCGPYKPRSRDCTSLRYSRAWSCSRRLINRSASSRFTSTVLGSSVPSPSSTIFSTARSLSSAVLVSVHFASRNPASAAREGCFPNLITLSTTDCWSDSASSFSPFSECTHAMSSQSSSVCSCSHPSAPSLISHAVLKCSNASAYCFFMVVTFPSSSKQRASCRSSAPYACFRSALAFSRHCIARS